MVSAVLNITKVLQERTSGLIGRAVVLSRFTSSSLIEVNSLYLVCVRRRVGEQARSVVLSLTSEVDIRLHELPFRPSRVSSS